MDNNQKGLQVFDENTTNLRMPLKVHFQGSVPNPINLATKMKTIDEDCTQSPHLIWNVENIINCFSMRNKLIPVPEDDTLWLS
jgi:hypothetical protein